MFINLYDGVVNTGVKIQIRGSSMKYRPSGSHMYRENRAPGGLHGFIYEFKEFMSKEGKHVLEPMYTETVKLITADIYNNIVKGGIKKFFMSMQRKIILLKIRKHLRRWWKLVLPKLEGNLKFSRSAKQKLKRCFYASGIEAYKKTVLDVKETVGEFFFMTLIEFKKQCITEKYSDNNLLATNFRKLEKSATYLSYYVPSNDELHGYITY